MNNLVFAASPGQSERRNLYLRDYLKTRSHTIAVELHRFVFTTTPTHTHPHILYSRLRPKSPSIHHEQPRRDRDNRFYE